MHGTEDNPPNYIVLTTLKQYYATYKFLAFTLRATLRFHHKQAAKMPKSTSQEQKLYRCCSHTYGS